MPQPFFHNAPPETFAKAQSLRRRMTYAEKVLWKVVRKNNLKGFYFRRQHPLGKFIVDFYCHEARLVIEVDGPIHTSPEAREYDETRTAFMEKRGLKVIRFSNGDVIRNTDFVIAEIEKHLPST